MKIVKKLILGAFVLTTACTFFASEKPTLKKEIKKTKREKARELAQMLETILELQEESEGWRKESGKWNQTANELPEKLSEILNKKITILLGDGDKNAGLINKNLDRVDQTLDKGRNTGLALVGGSASSALIVGVILIWFYFFMEERNLEKKLSIKT